MSPGSAKNRGRGGGRGFPAVENHWYGMTKYLICCSDVQLRGEQSSFLEKTPLTKHAKYPSEAKRDPACAWEGNKSRGEKPNLNHEWFSQKMISFPLCALPSAIPVDASLHRVLFWIWHSLIKKGHQNLEGEVFLFTLGSKGTRQIDCLVSRSWKATQLKGK